MARYSVIFAALLAQACAPSSQPLARPAYGSPGLSAYGGGFRIGLVNEWGQPLATYGNGGETWVEGTLGQRYQVRVDNPTGRRVEAVVTVDGRDVITGDAGSLDTRGYIIEPYGHVMIDGFRTSQAGWPPSGSRPRATATPAAWAVAPTSASSAWPCSTRRRPSSWPRRPPSPGTTTTRTATAVGRRRPWTRLPPPRPTAAARPRAASRRAWGPGTASSATPR
ncbi:MAG: hypothetical protein R3F43_20730 [bacterium]